MKYTVNYAQTNNLQIEVEAKDKEEARIKADEIIASNSFAENIEDSEKGYWEFLDIDEG